jgi:hypothetical protein
VSTSDKSDQYRAGFEAWARAEDCNLDRDQSGNYVSGYMKQAWRVWLGCKREASTEPSALVKQLRITAAMLTMGERIAWGSDAALMNQAADALDAGAGALSDDAKNAARYRFLCNDSTKMDGNFMIEHRASPEVDFDVLVMKFVIDRAIDAAIEAHTKAHKTEE